MANGICYGCVHFIARITIEKPKEHHEYTLNTCLYHKIKRYWYSNWCSHYKEDYSKNKNRNNCYTFKVIEKEGKNRERVL